MATEADLRALLLIPNESLSAEYKSWLNLSSNGDKARLAKAAIALANHGGGIIVLGMREQGDEGGQLVSLQRPPETSRYNQDDVNSAIRRFSDPPFHCELTFARHPDTRHEHAFVLVPGGFRVPIMSRRDVDGVIRSQRCYIRKPGPRSEEPLTAEEWRDLLDRCVRAGREDLLEAIRHIIQGGVDAAPAAPDDRQSLIGFRDAAFQRWSQLVAEHVPAPDNPSRFPHGHYEFAASITGGTPPRSLLELRDRLQVARSIRHTGWPPFIDIHRAPFEARPVGDGIEAWLGYPEAERILSPSADNSDFWQARPDGKLFTMRGYSEDSSERVAPGSIIDVALPIWRIGEALLFAKRFSDTFGNGVEQILFMCRFTGLANRRLGSLEARRVMGDWNIAADDVVNLEGRATPDQIEQNLAEIIHPLLVPLYERFSFFVLPTRIVTAELERMQANRF